MFPPAKKTVHKNKSYRYQEGGAVDEEATESVSRMGNLLNMDVDMSRGRAMQAAEPEATPYRLNPFRGSERRAEERIDDAARTGRNEARGKTVEGLFHHHNAASQKLTAYRDALVQRNKDETPDETGIVNAQARARRRKYDI